jgi:hypothetical protein
MKYKVVGIKVDPDGRVLAKKERVFPTLKKARVFKEALLFGGYRIELTEVA